MNIQTEVLQPKFELIPDGHAYPITPGHTLVIPRRHVDSFFTLTAEEKLDLIGLLEIAKAGLDEEFKPDSYKIGINDGPAASRRGDWTTGETILGEDFQQSEKPITSLAEQTDLQYLEI